jgi:ATP-dependent helicase/nuclease subunit A
VLYVALTRARHALYMITSFPGETSRAFTEAALLKQLLAAGDPSSAGTPVTIGGEAAMRLYERGDGRWFERFPVAQPAAEPAGALLPPGFADRPSRRRRLVQVEPSAEEETVGRAARLFDAETRDVLDFGSAIHALLARVAWIEEADADAIVRQWTATAAGVKEEVRRDVCVQFRAMLQADAVRRALAKPAGRAELWREKAFEIILDGGNWVTGAFDRVTVFRDERGRAVRAAILDYKSDRVDDPRRLDRAAEKYRPQLALYGRALSLILGLPPARIGLQLLFTRPARVVECRPDA